MLLPSSIKRFIGLGVGSGANILSRLAVSIHCARFKVRVNPIFSVIFTRGKNCYFFLFAILNEEALPKCILQLKE